VITVVVEVSQPDWLDESDAFFWESQLAFVHMTHSLVPCFAEYPEDYDVALMQKDRCSLTSEEHLSTRLSNRWDLCMSLFLGLARNRKGVWTNHASPRNPIATLLLCVGILLLVPLWLVVGFLTLGILWPPQVRSWIFKPSKGATQQKPEKFEYSAPPFATICNDLQEIKSTAYEKAQAIEQQVLELRRLFCWPWKKTNHC
jgi:hypothetical protein